MKLCYCSDFAFFQNERTTYNTEEEKNRRFSIEHCGFSKTYSSKDRIINFVVILLLQNLRLQHHCHWILHLARRRHHLLVLLVLAEHRPVLCTFLRKRFSKLR